MHKIYFMRANILMIFLITFHLSTTIKSQTFLPASSPGQTIKQQFGLGSIEVIYSRPGSKGRRVFGDLVPFNKLWRTGANAATKINFTNPVELYGRKVDSGSYVLYTIPGEENWEIIINKGTGNIGTEGYKESEDVARFKIQPKKIKKKIALFTIQFADVQPEQCELQLIWENKLISIPITTNIKEKIRAQINAALLTNNKPYWEAAQFYYENDKNLNKALEYATKASDINLKAYWIFLYKAKIQQEMGDKAGALISSKISLKLAQEAKSDDYIKMNEKLQKELIKK